MPKSQRIVLVVLIGMVATLTALAEGQEELPQSPELPEAQLFIEVDQDLSDDVNLSYMNLWLDPTTTCALVVQVNASALKHDSIDMKLEGSAFTANKREAISPSNIEPYLLTESSIWIGEMEDQVSGEVIFLHQSGRVTGVIDLGPVSFELTPTDQMPLHFLRALPRQSFPPMLIRQNSIVLSKARIRKVSCLMTG